MPVLFEREKQFLQQFTKREAQTLTKLLRQFLLVFDAEDNLYCHQPLCQLLLSQQFNFIVVCRPTSHPTLYEHLLPIVVTQGWTGKVEETYTYRYLNQVPLKDDDDALLVNWCELTVSRPNGKVTYKNSCATNHVLTDETVTEIVLVGRTHWKVENENNNTLKTKGYNLEHNFGH